MAKRRKRRPVSRRRKAVQAGIPIDYKKPLPPIDRIPSAATLFRFHLVDEQTKGMLGKLSSAIKPIVWLRDRDAVNKIKQAQTAQELVDLIPIASGIAEEAWLEQMSKYGSEVLPLIRKRLKTRARLSQDKQPMIYEKLIADLRWRGESGAEVLLDCFDDMDDYGKCLACVVLGILGASSGADKMWEFYQKVKNHRGEHFVGALWGLADVGDPRACDALVELLLNRRIFYELFGFFSLAGDARAVIPLLWATAVLPQDDKTQPLMALTRIGHQTGREALIAELNKGRTPDDPREESESMADTILSKPASEAEEYFAIFYRGLNPNDLARLAGDL